MKLKEAIILAGGLGTRLAHVLPGTPKPMADISGRPFLERLLSRLNKKGMEHIILAVGYKADLIENYFSDHLQPMELLFSTEDEPLGTGGCIKKAIGMAKDENILVVNGDTFFDCDPQLLFQQHGECDADLTLALKYEENPSRYGSVRIDPDGRVRGFSEKGKSDAGLIHAGVMVMKRHLLDAMPEKFSFETDFLAKRYQDLRIFGHRFEGYFIDIGIPEDYERAKKELS